MDTSNIFRQIAVTLLLSLAAATASAGLFNDDEARRAILELRQRVEVVRQSVETVRRESEQNVLRAHEDNTSLRRSLLELQNQIEIMRSELATLRGANEQLAREVADMQRLQKDVSKGVEERLRQFEPVKVVLDGREFMADPAEKKDFDAALGVFRKADFSAAQSGFVNFLKRYPQSGYRPSVLFWLGNAQYATRDYKEAMLNFRALIARDPEHLRAPEAMLSIANCQIELKDPRGAQKTLDELIKSYPQSEAAVAAKERLLRLK